MIMILEAEIEAMDKKAGQKLTELVGGDIADFVKSSQRYLKFPDQPILSS
jgi:hypothetical protein